MSTEELYNIIKNGTILEYQINDIEAHNELVLWYYDKLTETQINKIINNSKSNIAHSTLVYLHSKGKLELTSKQIDTVINNPKSIDAHQIIIYIYNNQLQLTEEQKKKLGIK